MRTSRRGVVDPFIVMDVMEAARAAEEAGRSIVHMEVGQPGTGAPMAALDRWCTTWRRGPLGYTVALGLPSCARASPRHHADRYGVDLDPCPRRVVTARRLGGPSSSLHGVSSTLAHGWGWASPATRPTGRSSMRWG